jgi:hypothetical protein
MPQKSETRRAFGRRRAPEMSAVAADNSDNSAPLLVVQATKLLQRFNVSMPVARTIAELAFEAGRADR